MTSAAWAREVCIFAIFSVLKFAKMQIVPV